MKCIPAALATAILLSPMPALAQDHSETSLAGFHIGADAVRDALEARQPTNTREADRNGYGGRAHVGYDAVVGDIILVGAEIGVGSGGRTVDQASLAGGRYRVNPGMTYDATARIGIAPGGNFALYGRAGYRWLRTEQTVSGQTSGNFTSRETERGFTYGGGAEVAVSQNFAIRAEYNRTEFSQNLRQSRISLGVSFRF